MNQKVRCPKCEKIAMEISTYDEVTTGRQDKLIKIKAECKECGYTKL